jgi:hypothetical protein
VICRSSLAHRMSKPETNCVQSFTRIRLVTSAASLYTNLSQARADNRNEAARTLLQVLTTSCSTTKLPTCWAPTAQHTAFVVWHACITLTLTFKWCTCTASFVHLRTRASPNHCHTSSQYPDARALCAIDVPAIASAETMNNVLYLDCALLPCKLARTPICCQAGTATDTEHLL